MKIGILSDIHGNLRALKVILHAFRSHNVEKIICLGDMIGYYHQSLEVLDLLMKLNVTAILGNHEAYLMGFLKSSPEKWQVYFLDQVKKDISPKQLAWISALSKSLDIHINGKRIAFFHGSPWDPLEEYIYQDSNKFDDFVHLHWDYIFLGHTHYPMFKQAGNVNIVNPGSCGQPRDGDLRASAAVFNSENEIIVIIRESYDVQSTIKEARLAGVAPVAIRKLERGERYDKG
jgi:putative phosphoesterase